MGAALSEPCIYDKLSESIDILRQSGYRYGMSEREIETFIKQVLETNEPRREPPEFPMLRATIKVVVGVGVVLLIMLAFAYPHNFSQSGSVSTEQNSLVSPLSHIRLLSLPIAKKYNLHSVHACWSVFGWSHSVLNCSGCLGVSAALELSTSKLHSVTTATRPVLLKAGEALRLNRQHLQTLYSSNSASMTILMEDEQEVMSEEHGFPQGPANFSLLWLNSGLRDDTFRSLFPGALLRPLLESVGTTLQRCRVTHSTGSQSRGQLVSGWLLVADGFSALRVFPHQRCQNQCSAFNLQLQPGDLVFAEPRLWQLEVFPGRGENVLCDGTTL